MFACVRHAYVPTLQRSDQMTPELSSINSVFNEPSSPKNTSHWEKKEKEKTKRAKVKDPFNDVDEYELRPISKRRFQNKNL